MDSAAGPKAIQQYVFSGSTYCSTAMHDLHVPPGTKRTHLLRQASEVRRRTRAISAAVPALLLPAAGGAEHPDDGGNTAGGLHRRQRRPARSHQIPQQAQRLQGHQNQGPAGRIQTDRLSSCDCCQSNRQTRRRALLLRPSMLQCQLGDVQNPYG